MITIHKYPLYIAPSYRPVIFDVKSDVSIIAHPELNIKATLYIKTGNVFEMVAIKYQSMVNGNDFYRFNFANILQAYIEHDVYDNTTNEIKTPNTKSIKSYLVHFEELYNNTQGIMTSYYHGVTSIHHATNSTLQHTQTQNLDPWTILLYSNPPVQTFTKYPTTYNFHPISMGEIFPGLEINIIDNNTPVNFSNHDITAVLFGSDGLEKYRITNNTGHITATNTGIIIKSFAVPFKPDNYTYKLFSKDKTSKSAKDVEQLTGNMNVTWKHR